MGLGSAAEASWMCSNCASLNAGFHWPQCGACGYNNADYESPSPARSPVIQHESYDTSVETEFELGPDLPPDLITAEETTTSFDTTLTEHVIEGDTVASTTSRNLVSALVETAATTHNDILEDGHHVVSGSPSPAASVASIFSSNSIASSATEFSRTSGYSAVQIVTASKELVSIFHENPFLQALYTAALRNSAIGPERLQRNLRRLLKAYAEQLKGEATDQLEFLAARLVSIRARGLAQSIVEKFSITPAPQHMDDVGQYHDSSEEEADTLPVNEDALADLIMFRRFLVESHAFETLQEDLRMFISPTIHKSAAYGDFSDHNDRSYNSVSLPAPNSLALSADRAGGDFRYQPQSEHRYRESFINRGKGIRTWQGWRREVLEVVDAYMNNMGHLPVATSIFYLLMEGIFLATDDVMVAAALLEPALLSKHTRLRWSCNCGDLFFSDIKELRQGGIAQLAAQMEHSSGVKVSVSPYRHHSGNQQYVVPRPDRWIRNGIVKMRTAFQGAARASPSLPHHNTSSSIALGSATAQSSSDRQTLHLMACIHRDPLRKSLQQDRIDGITTDPQILSFMRQQYIRHRGRTLNILSLKRVKEVCFVKFWLPMGGCVDVRQHDRYCVTCCCMPPQDKVEPSSTAEYKCCPIPPKTLPPIPPEYLAMLLYHPSEAHEDDTWILNQLPKRICGLLQGAPGEPAQGWGVYYREGWDRELITLAIFLILVLATLLFGVLWSKYKFDVQGAFGVSAWVATLGGILITLLVPRLEKMA